MPAFAGVFYYFVIFGVEQAEVYCEQKRAIPSWGRENFRATARKLFVTQL